MVDCLSTPPMMCDKDDMNILTPNKDTPKLQNTGAPKLPTDTKFSDLNKVIHSLKVKFLALKSFFRDEL